MKVRHHRAGRLVPPLQESATSGGLPRALWAVLAVGGFLRLVEIGSDVGGFHAYNEGNYLLIARNASFGSLFRPSLAEGATFLETPPLYPYLVALLSKVLSPPHLAGRLLSVAASLGLVVLTWVLARRRAGPAASLLAAAVVAVAPVAVMTGRNVQTDPLYLFLVVAALALADPLREGGPRNWPAAGLLLGMALVTKLFAAVIAVAWGLAWLLLPESRPRGTTARIVAAALLAGAPAAIFYGVNFLTDRALLNVQVGGGALAATAFPSKGAELMELWIEAFWAASPLVALALALGVVHALVRRSRQTLYLGLPLLALLVFYSFVHKHSYYLLGLLPFAAILAAEAAEEWIPPRGRTAAAVALVMSGAFVSLVDLTSMKLGFSEFAQLGETAAAFGGQGKTYVLDADVQGSASPVVTYYVPGSVVVAGERLPFSTGGKVTNPARDSDLLFFTSPTESGAPGVLVFSRIRYGLTLFGVTVASAHPNPNFFRQGAYVVKRTGRPWGFGFTAIRNYSALAAARLGSGRSAFRTAKGLELREDLAPPGGDGRNGP